MHAARPARLCLACDKESPPCGHRYLGSNVVSGGRTLQFLELQLDLIEKRAYSESPGQDFGKSRTGISVIPGRRFHYHERLSSGSGHVTVNQHALWDQDIHVRAETVDDAEDQMRAAIVACRSAVEPVMIGHLTDDHRMNRNYLWTACAMPPMPSSPLSATTSWASSDG